ncbi:MAG TPA: hypothetical protein PKC18_05115, partial [Lacipirellulaceae bacterium]|nr:hypothetical protein [Lacipirellulaceae bacterium]
SLLGTDLLGFETPVSTSKSISLSGLNIAAGEHYYMRWHFSVVDGTSDSFIVGIDNFSITGHAATAIPEASALVALPLSGAVWTVLAALRRLR